MTIEHDEMCGCGHVLSVHRDDGACTGEHVEVVGTRPCECEGFWRRGDDGRRVWDAPSPPQET
jgi:hypothetical protein